MPDLPRPGGARGFAAEPDGDGPCRQGVKATPWTIALDRTPGFATLALPDAPFAEAAFTPSGPAIFSARLAAQAWTACPTIVPNHELQGHRRPPPAGHDLAARAQLPQLHLRQRQKPAHHRSRPLLEMHPDAAARGIADGSTVRVFNDRGSYLCHAEVSTRARPAW